MISEIEKKVKLGNYGEILLSEILRSQGYDVKLSLDAFDKVKDMTVNGATVEVKTQVPWYVQKAFTIQPNQYLKCANADFVVFIAVPSLGLTDIANREYDGNIYTVEPKKVKWRTFQTRHGRQMFLLNIKQEGVTLCHKITDKETLKQLFQLTTSRA